MLLADGAVSPNASTVSPSDNKNGWGNQGIWDLSKVYLPELLERVSAGKAQEAAGTLSICVNFTVLFVMAYNNKKVGAIFLCHITFCGQNQLILQIPNI